MSERPKGPSTPLSRRQERHERAIAGTFLDWSHALDFGHRSIEEVPLPSDQSVDLHVSDIGPLDED